MVSRLLFLEEDQLRRAWPFFALYLVLFAALTLADGLSLALFVARLGADQLPRFWALSAVCVMLAVGWYLHAADRPGSQRTFQLILFAPLVLFVGVWAGLATRCCDERSLGLLFLGRELAFALVLLQFGAFLQEYFTRAELSRVMPVIYAGGRLGGIAAGAVLAHLSRLIEPLHLLPLIGLLLGAGMVGVHLIGRFATAVEEPIEPALAESGLHCRASNQDALAQRSAGGLSADTSTARGFLRFVWCSPLLFWITLSTAALFLCRAGLVLQYNRCLERHFASDAALAQFWGRYAQIALTVSLLFQLFVMGRLVARIGLRGAQMSYAALVVVAAAGGLGGMRPAAAVLARFVETELRFGLRNPLSQMIVCLFPRTIRTQARAWSRGVVIPAATIVAGLGLHFVVRAGVPWTIVLATLIAAAGYFAASLGLTAQVEPASGRVALSPQRLRLGQVLARRVPFFATRKSLPAQCRESA